MDSYEIEIDDDMDMERVQNALSEAKIGDEGEDSGIGNYLRSDNPRSVFVWTDHASRALAIINELRYAIDEDEVTEIPHDEGDDDIRAVASMADKFHALSNQFDSLHRQAAQIFSDLLYLREQLESLAAKAVEREKRNNE